VNSHSTAHRDLTVISLVLVFASLACGDNSDSDRNDMRSPNESVIPGAPPPVVHEGEYNTQPAPTLAPRP
jgi:hypothetical protein